MKLQHSRIAAFLTLVLCASAPFLFGQEPTTYWVEADDGILLATDVYLPLEGEGPWPVLLSRTPYGRRRSDFVEACEGANEREYACVVQDWRSFGESGGEGGPWVFDDGDDGRTTIDWIATQWWCDGMVGSFGISASTETQFRFGPGAGTPLRCMALAVSTADSYSAAFPGGVMVEGFILGWYEAMNREEIIPLILAHRLRDEFWLPLDNLARSDEFAVPGLHAGGWYDLFTQHTLDAFTTLQEHGGPGARGEQKLIVGPWTHELGGNSAGHLMYPVNANIDVDFRFSELDERGLAWFDHWLKGEDSGVEDWPAALVYLMGPAWSPVGIPLEANAPGNVWVALEAWPPPATEGALHLRADGRLTSAAPSSGELELLVDPNDPVPSRGGRGLDPPRGPVDQRPIEARDDVLVFSTDELPAPLYVMGRISCTLWIRPDTTDLDLAVRLSDVYPSGHSMLVTDGIQRGRMRCGDDHECFLTPGEPAEITVDLWSTALVFNTGHRVRISVSGSNWPRFEVNPNHGGDLNSDEPGIIARPDLLFGPDHPSRLTLPIWTPPPRLPSGRIGP